MELNVKEIAILIANFLEQFLRGLTDCGIIAKFTIQFLEKPQSLIPPKTCIFIQNLVIQLINNLQMFMKKLTDSGMKISDCVVESVTKLPSNEVIISKSDSSCSSDSVIGNYEIGHKVHLKKEYEGTSLALKMASESIELDNYVDDTICKSDLHYTYSTYVVGEHKTGTLVAKKPAKFIVNSTLPLLDFTEPTNKSLVCSGDSLHITSVETNKSSDLVPVSVISSSPIKETSKCDSDSFTDNNIGYEYTSNSLEAESMEFENDAKIFRQKIYRAPRPLESKIKHLSHFSQSEEKNSVSNGTETIFADIIELGPNDILKHSWCEICEKEFPSPGSLKRHLMSSHTKIHWCHTCLKAVSANIGMENHVKSSHSDIPFICAICGRSLRSQPSLQRHTRVHGGVRATACEICGQTFSRSEYHREHMKVHTGEKPFACSSCGKTFSKSSNLTTHLLVHKSPDKGHVCKFCSKVFKRRDKLKEHTLRHLKIKRFVCKLCPKKAYSEKRDLTKHLKKCHP